MGREILYCSVCGNKLISDDFTRGRALTLDAKSYCSGCYTAPLRPAKPATARRVAAARAQRLWIGLAGGGLALMAVVVVLLLPAAAPPAPSEGEQAVVRAREFAVRQPEAIDEALKLWQEAHRLGRPEARPEIDRLLAERLRATQRELAQLKSRVDERLEAEQYGAAVILVQEARTRRDDPAWAAAVAAQLEDVRRRARVRLEDLRQKAAAAKAAGRPEEVEELRKAVASWGLPDLVEELDRTLGSVSPPGRLPLPTGAKVLVSFPEPPRPYGLVGREEGGVLHANARGRRAQAALERGGPIFTLPARGELRMAFRVNRETTLNLRMRVKSDEEARPDMYEMKVKAEGNRWETLSADLSEFRNAADQPLPAGGVVTALVATVEHPDPTLEISHLVVFEK